MISISDIKLLFFSANCDNRNISFEIILILVVALPLKPFIKLKIFKLSKSGKVAGSKVTDGEIKNNSKARIIRDGKVVYDGSITSIFREKNAAKEVKSGLECGITFKNFLDFKEKDMIESYKVDMIERQIND